MALHNPPSWLQNGSHPAENDRGTITQAIISNKGIIDYGDLKVSQSATPGMSVLVAAGRAAILGTQTATQGMYIAWNDANTTVTIAAANPSLPRIDRIVISVQDSYYSGVNNQVIFQAITGTPASVPVAPSEPSNSLTLALVAVAAGATSIVNGNITDSRVLASYTDTHTTASNVAADSLLVSTIASQTGKAVKVINSTGTQTFAVAPNGTVTWPDGSTQSSASTYDPSLTFTSVGTTTYTFIASDKQKMVYSTSSSPTTFTVPSSGSVSFPIGCQINISQIGTGQLTINAASSPTPVTLNYTPGPNLRAQYSSATLIQFSTDNWLLVGDLSI